MPKAKLGPELFVIGSPEQFFFSRSSPGAANKPQAEKGKGEIQPDNGIGPWPSEFAAINGVVASDNPSVAIGGLSDEAAEFLRIVLITAAPVRLKVEGVKFDVWIARFGSESGGKGAFAGIATPDDLDATRGGTHC